MLRRALLCLLARCSVSSSSRTGRRSKIELILAKVQYFLPVEEALEAKERWALAPKAFRGTSAPLSEVKVLKMARNFTFAAPDPKRLLNMGAANRSADSGWGHRMNLNFYLTRGEKSLTDLRVKKKAYGSDVAEDPGEYRRRRSVIGGESDGTPVNWGTGAMWLHFLDERRWPPLAEAWNPGGHVALGRVLGVFGLPLRLAWAAGRRVLVRPARRALAGPGRLSEALNATDAVLRKGPYKALAGTRYDPRYGRVSHTLGPVLLYTEDFWLVLRTAWRTPVDGYRYARRFLQAAALSRPYAFWGSLAPASWPAHERLEAALLREARREAKAYLGRVGPRAAARRKRRLADAASKRESKRRLEAAKATTKKGEL